MPDVVGAYAGNELVAGLGVNYRDVALPDGRTKLVGVLTAAWTLPEHRGRWHLRRLIQRIKSVAAERGCVALLSFVTLDNASAAVLARLRAVPFPTFYLHGGAPRLGAAGADFTPRAAVLRAADVAADGAGAIRFAYGWDDWRQQHLDRPHATVSLAVGASVAVLEETESTDRIQWLGGSSDAAPQTLAALLSRAAGRGKQLVHFTMSGALARAAREQGLEVRDGAMMVIDLAEHGDDWWRGTWHVQGGDRM
jgi:GNAT superfamily N-acetyltransferase